MTRIPSALLLVLLAAAIGDAPAGAAPWRLESGLPAAAPEPPGAGSTGAALEEPASLTGVWHPNARLGDFRLGVMGDLFLSLRLDHRQDAWFTEFELSRAQLGAFLAWHSGDRLGAGIHVSLESIRSSASRSYFGIDGDSLLPRFKYAFVEVTPLSRWVALRAGLVPDLLVPVVEASWDFRVQGPSGIERDGLFSPGDLGATVEVALPWHLGSVALAATNGEGTHLRDQNNGKNITAALRVTPLGARLPELSLQLLYRDGSVGNGSASDSRVAGGIVYAGARLGAGAIGTYAIGFQGHGEWTAAHATGWLRGELPLRFFLFGRGDVLWPDAGAAGSLVGRAVGGVAWALPALARFVLSCEITLPRGAPQAMVPALEEQLIQLQIEGRI